MVDHHHRVLETLYATGIDLGRCLIVGSAVMAMHNIRAARDVDIIPDPALFEEIAASGQTPSGIALEMRAASMQGRKRYVNATGPYRECLPIDIRSYEGPEEFGVLLERAEHQYRRGGIVIHRDTLEEVRERKRRMRRPKDIIDVRLITRHLSALEINRVVLT